MKLASLEEAFQGAVTVGERGQVVIPADAREALEISPGDKLLVFAPPGGIGVFFGKLKDMQRISEMLGPLLADENGNSSGEGSDV